MRENCACMAGGNSVILNEAVVDVVDGTAEMLVEAEFDGGIVTLLAELMVVVVLVGCSDS